MVLCRMGEREPGCGGVFEDLSPVIFYISPFQGIPWKKVDYFDNGIICNLIEHVSYPLLIFGTSPEHPSPVSLIPFPSPHLVRRVKEGKG